jgi:hypothetical protein
LTVIAGLLLPPPAALGRQDESKPAAKPAAPQTGQGTIRVRPANQPIYDQAKSLAEKVAAATERLSARAAKPDELRGKTDQLRREVVDLYRALHEIRELGDELVLRGEQDGLAVRQLANALKPPLDAAVGDVRAHLGSTQGLFNAMVRRAKEQTVALKQLDDRIRQIPNPPEPNKWTEAKKRLDNLRDAAEEVGRFVEPKESEQIFRPIEERAARIRPEFLAEKKTALEPSLAQEFAAVRPNLEELLDSLASASREARDKKSIRWNGQPATGPKCIEALIDEWTRIDRAVSLAAAVLHARGSPAEPDLKSLAVDYDAARTRTLVLLRDMIMAEADSLPAATLDKHYAEYLSAIPKLLTALHGSLEEFQPAATALNLLADKSPALDARVRAYRAATDEAIKWRRRVVQQYLKSVRAPTESKPAAEPTSAAEARRPAEPLAKLLDRPPALPGQEGPAGLKRVNQSYWTIDQPPEFVASVWSDHWKDSAVTVPTLRVHWPTGADPQWVSPWHRRICADATFPRQQLVALADALARDLLVDDKHPPLTLEAALAIESALRGPYIELGGTITAARVESLSDRLADLADPLDLAGAMRPESLVTFPPIAASVRLRVKPAWFAHDLFFWSAAPPVSPDKPPASQPIASQPPGSAPKKAADAPPDPPSDGDAASPSDAGAPKVSAQQPATATGSQAGGAPPKKLEPAQSPPSVPKGGVKF